MSDRVSPWVKWTVIVYVALVLVGSVMGMVSGGLGAFWMVPLLYPWIAIDFGSSILDTPIASFTIMPLCGALNACLLFLFLRFIDRRLWAASATNGTTKKRKLWVNLLPLCYALIVVIATALGTTEDETEPLSVSSVILLPLMFPWIIAWFFLPKLPEVVGNIILPLATGLLNAFLLYMLLRFLERRRARKAVVNAPVASE